MKRLITMVLFAVLLLGALAALPAARSAFAASGPSITQAHPCGHSHCDSHECKSGCSSSSCPCH